MLFFQYGVAFVHFTRSLLPAAPPPAVFPFDKFPLAFFAFVESEDIRQDAAGNCFDLVLGNVGVIDQLFSFAQIYLRIAQEYAFAGV